MSQNFNLSKRVTFAEQTQDKVCFIRNPLCSLHLTTHSFRFGICSKSIRMRRFYTECNEMPYSDTQGVYVTAPNGCSCQQIGSECSIEFHLGLANHPSQCKFNGKDKIIYGFVLHYYMILSYCHN